MNSTKEKGMTRDEQKQSGSKIKIFLRKNCVPSLVEDIIAIRRAKAANEDVGSHPYLRAVGKNALRIAASAGVQFGSAYSFGVLAWQTEAGAPTTNSLDNASPIANSFAMLVTSSVNPANQMTVANALLGADMLLSAIRIGVEQALWRKYKVTPDFPGTVVSPLVIGAAEMMYKTAALANTPDDGAMRLAQGVKGVYGNLVRLIMVGVIYTAGKIHDTFSTKTDNPESNA